MGFALRLALIAFTGTSIFASNAYAYYFPMLAGLCVAVDRASAELFAAQKLAGSNPAPPAQHSAAVPAAKANRRPGRGLEKAVTRITCRHDPRSRRDSPS